MLRKGEPTQADILQDLANRVKVLEDSASRRMLPPGFNFVYDTGLNQLLVLRLSDNATVVIM